MRHSAVTDFEPASPGLLAACGILLLAFILALVVDRVDGPRPLSAQSTSYSLRLESVYAGTAQCIAAEGDLVVAGVGKRLRIVDFGESGRPRTLAWTEALPGWVKGVAVEAGFAFAAAEGGTLHVFDLRDPRAPLPGPVVDLPQWRGEGFPDEVFREPIVLTVSGDRLYAAGGDGRLQVIDITRPGDPWWMGSIDTFRRVRSLAAPAASSVFLSDRWGFAVVDASDPRRMRVIGTYGVEESRSIEDGALVVHGRYAYLMLSPGLRVVDVADPARPRWVKQVNLRSDTRLAIYEDQLVVMEPSKPRSGDSIDGLWFRALRGAELSGAPELEFLPMGEIVSGTPILVAEGARLFVADTTMGLRALDVDGSGAVRELGAVAAELVAQAAIVGERAAVAVRVPISDVWRIDLLDAAAPEQAARTASLPVPAEVLDMGVAGDRLIVLGRQDLTVIDPAADGGPVIVATEAVASIAVDLEVGETLALVNDNKNAIVIVDLDDPNRPTVVTRLDSMNANAMALSGRIAYIADRGRLRIFDLTDPASPREIPFAPLDVGYPGPDRLSFRWVATRGDLLFGQVEFDWNTLVVFDISDPTQPTFEGNFDPNARWSGIVAFDGPRLFAQLNVDSPASPLHRFFVVDTADPAELRSVWSQDVPARIRDLDVRADRVHVAAREAGLLVYAPRPAVSVPTRTPRPAATPPPASPVPTAAPDPARPRRIFLPLLQRPAPPPKDSLRLSIQRQLGGVTSAVATDGRHAYLVEGEWRLSVLDIADSARPTVLGSVAFPPELPSGIGYTVVALLPEAGRVYLLMGRDDPFDLLEYPYPSFILTFDVARPDQPRHLGTLVLPQQSRAMVLAGHYLYVNTFVHAWNLPDPSRPFTDFALKIVDVADPSAPRVTGELPDTTLLAGMVVIGKRLIGVAVPYDGGTQDQLTLETYDISKAGHPVHTDRLALDAGLYPEVATFIRTGQECLLITSRLEALRFRVSAEGKPELVVVTRIGPYERFVEPDQFIEFYSAQNVAASDRYLYLLQRDVDMVLVKLDLQDLRATVPPEALVKLDRSREDFLLGQNLLGIAAVGDRVLIAGGSGGGMQIVDPSQPAGRHQLGAYAPPGIVQGMESQGPRLLLGTGNAIEIWDVADPVAPERRGSFLDATPYRITGDRLAIGQSLAFVAKGDALEAIDIRDPAAPVSAGKLSDRTAGYAFDAVATEGDRAYVVDARFGLRVVEASEGKLVERTRIATVGGARDVAVQAGRAYLATTRGLEIIDVSSPGAPRELGYLNLAPGADGSQAVKVVADEQWVYLVTVERPVFGALRRWRLAELIVIDAADPTRPREAAMLQLPATTVDDLRLGGDRLWIGAGQLIVVDVANPLQPELAAVIPGAADFSLAADGRHVFVGGDGLSIAAIEAR